MKLLAMLLGISGAGRATLLLPMLLYTLLGLQPHKTYQYYNIAHDKVYPKDYSDLHGSYEYHFKKTGHKDNVYAHESDSYHYKKYDHNDYHKYHGDSHDSDYFYYKKDYHKYYNKYHGDAHDDDGHYKDRDHNLYKHHDDKISYRDYYSDYKVIKLDPPKVKIIPAVVKIQQSSKVKVVKQDKKDEEDHTIVYE